MKNYETKVIHEYNNAGLYSIKRPDWVIRRMPYLSWYTIRVRKSSNERFRTLADMCGLEIELLLLTEKVVKMVLKERYEYTLYFESDFHAESFANVLYHTAIKASSNFIQSSVFHLIT